MKRFWLVAVMLGVLSAGAFAYEGSIAFQGGIGAKALGMGGAFTALADDGTFALWNPAGIVSFGEEIWIGGATSQLFGMVPYQYVAGGMSFAGYAVGLGWGSVTAGDLYSANAILGTVGVKLGDFGVAGVNLKYYMETVAAADASGFGFDIGLLVPIIPELSIGVVAKDLGASIGGQTVSPVYVLGLGSNLLEGALKLGLDLELSSAFAVKNLRAGLAFQLIEALAVRAGMVAPEMDFGAYYFSVGAGFALGGLTVDAAYVLSPNPGESLVLSATFLFGGLFAPAPTPAE